MELASTNVQIHAWMQLKEQLFLFFSFSSAKKIKNNLGNSLHKVPHSINILSNEIFEMFFS